MFFINFWEGVKQIHVMIDANKAITIVSCLCSYVLIIIGQGWMMVSNQ